MSTFRTWIFQLRVINWIKNLILILPFLLYADRISFDSLNKLALAFISFCFLASAVYIGNDIYDLESDRRHISKKLRPLANGDITRRAALFSAFLLAGFGIALTSFLGPRILALGTGYLFLNFLYTLKLKKNFWLCISLLALFHFIRFWIGLELGHFKPNPWVNLFLFVNFMALATASHQSEIQNTWKRHNAFRVYAVLTCVSLVALSIALISKEVRGPYPGYSFLYIFIPLLIFFYCQFWLSAQNCSKFPLRILAFLKDKRILFCGSASLTIIFLAKLNI